MVKIDYKSSLKRLIDVIVVTLLLLLLWPVFILTALLVKITSKGDIIFKQARVGKNQKNFICYKFRSMYTASSAAVHKEYIKKQIVENDFQKKSFYKLKNDSRITPFGRFIRKTSIDELPQLFNVLKGDMSIVGPRPVICYEVELYDNDMLKRFLVKPGLTGLWQVNGRSKLSYREMVRLDIKYIDNWSLFLDIKILIKTIKTIFLTSTAC